MKQLLTHSNGGGWSGNLIQRAFTLLLIMCLIACNINFPSFAEDAVIEMDLFMPLEDKSAYELAGEWWSGDAFVPDADSSEYLEFDITYYHSGWLKLGGYHYDYSAEDTTLGLDKILEKHPDIRDSIIGIMLSPKAIKTNRASRELDARDLSKFPNLKYILLTRDSSSTSNRTYTELVNEGSENAVDMSNYVVKLIDRGASVSGKYKNAKIILDANGATVTCELDNSIIAAQSDLKGTVEGRCAIYAGRLSPYVTFNKKSKNSGYISLRLPGLTGAFGVRDNLNQSHLTDGAENYGNLLVNVASKHPSSDVIYYEGKAEKNKPVPYSLFNGAIFTDGTVFTFNTGKELPKNFFEGAKNVDVKIINLDGLPNYVFRNFEGDISYDSIGHGPFGVESAKNTCLHLTDVTLPFTGYADAFAGNGIAELKLHGTGDFSHIMFPELRTLTLDEDCIDFDSDLQSSKIEKIYMLSTPKTTMTKAKLPSAAMVYVEQGSGADVWCENLGVAHTHITDEDLDVIKNGIAPSIVADTKLFDAKSPVDINFEVSLGKKPAGADGIAAVYVSGEDIGNNFELVEDKKLVIKKEYLSKLANGTHSIGVLFDNNTYRIGSTITVVNSSITSGGNAGDNQNPPEALTTITYEFYKDYPDYVIIPVKLNSATAITELKIGQTVVDESNYELQEGAILLNKTYLATLDAGKYRVLPTFNDPKNTQISNLQLIVYEKLEDRAAPGLLQSRIIFKGQDLRMRFNYGSGDLMADNVLALVIDDKIVLPSGETKDFTNTQVNKVRAAFTASMAMSESDEEDEASASNARRSTSSNAKRKARTSEQREIMLALDSDEPVFTVEADEIVLKGNYVESLGLSDGDHLIGAIFDNSEKTTDLRKVVLTIESEQENPGPDTPGTDTPGTGDKPGTDTPGTGDNPGTSNPGTSNPGTSNPGTSNKPNTGGNTGNGGSGGTGGSSNPTRHDNPLVTNVVNNDGSINTGYKPSVPNMGGAFTKKHKGTGEEVLVYVLPDGEVPLGAWVADGINWYYQGLEGYILTDWFLDTDGTWYELDKQQGYMLRGWHFEEADGKWYYLNPADGKMLTGWQFIDGVWYYFNPVTPMQTYFGDNINGWYYDSTNAGRPFGSMYSNEVTPDNYFVTVSGAYVK